MPPTRLKYQLQERDMFGEVKLPSINQTCEPLENPPVSSIVFPANKTSWRLVRAFPSLPCYDDHRVYPLIVPLILYYLYSYFIK